MAKKDKVKNENPENNSENVNETNPETPETPVVPEEKKESKKESKKVEAVIPDVTPKDAFLKALYSNEGKYVLVSNGVQICSYLNKPNIAIHDRHFEVNGTPYSYSGIEVKHI